MKVLLLEDDLDLSQSLRDLLAEEGYYVVTVSNGAAGVRELVKQTFDVIVCDVSMPLLPGDMFYRAVQRSKPRLCDRFIFITGENAREPVRRFLQQIDARVLLKPFSGNELLKLIEAIISSDSVQIRFEPGTAEDYSARAFTGIVRSVDLDQHEFELREKQLQMRCIYPPQIEAGVIRLLNKHVRTFGRIERLSDGHTSVFKVERIEAANN
jgi:DNA-binding response OmpR family regulator